MATGLPVLWLWLVVMCWGLQPATPSRRTMTHSLWFRPQSVRPEVSESSHKWFTQQLDHLDPINDRQWQQRYWVNDHYYRRGAPVFLYVAGEWEETGFSEGLKESWEELSVLNDALMFKLEHRFYGQSQPTGGNMTVQDLQYLSSSQALEDLANFIVAMTRQFRLPPGSRWVVFGCSYSATLAAWLRYKYPHLVYAAVASSAPLLVKTNFPEYFNAVEEALVKFYGNVTRNTTMGTKCVEALKQANKEVKELIRTPEGLNLTIQNFGLKDLELDWNKTSESYNKNSGEVFNTLSTTVSIPVQGNYYNATTKTWAIERFCDTMLNASLGGVVDRYAEACKAINAEEDPEEDVVPQQWFYQTCAEFGFFQTAENESSLFGDYMNEKYYFDECKATFGETFTEEFVRRGIDRTARRYGGLELDATRVLYIYGSLDPWFTLGLNRTRNPLSPVIVIEGASHCSDTAPRTYHDSKALKDARRKTYNTLNEWLSSPSTNALQ